MCGGRNPITTATWTIAGLRLGSSRSCALLAPAQRGRSRGGGHDRRTGIKVHRHLNVLLLDVGAHIVHPGEGAQTDRALGFARVHVPVQGQRHRMSKALPADAAPELEWRICTMHGYEI